MDEDFREAGMRVGTLMALVFLFLIVLAVVLSSFENDTLAKEACVRRGGRIITVYEGSHESWTCFERDSGHHAVP